MEHRIPCLIYPFEAAILDFCRHGHDRPGLPHGLIRVDRKQAIFELGFQLIDDCGGDEACRPIQSLFNCDELAVFIFFFNLVGNTAFARAGCAPRKRIRYRPRYWPGTGMLRLRLGRDA